MKQDLYTINKDVTCIKCGNIGAIKFYGSWYPQGLKEESSGYEFLQEYKNKPFMSHAMGFGGTIPHQCLNCGNTGLIDMNGLEGYEKAFTKK